MVTRSQFLWLLIAFVICGIVYLCWGILTPFVLSIAISYILSPVAAFLESKLKLKRWLVALILVTFIFGILLAAAIVVLPLIYHQALIFIKYTPQYKTILDEKIMRAITEHLGNIDAVYLDKISSASVNLMMRGFDNIVSFLEKIWSSGFMIVDFLWLLVLVPFITFHMIKDWDPILTHMINSIPKKKQKVTRKLFTDLSEAIAGAVRGQFNVCLILALYYTVTLSAFKINYSILLGVTIGIMSFVPFLGTVVGMLASIMVAYLQFGTFNIIAYVLAIFTVGALLDNAVISPHIVGRKIGLHPIWIIFSILLGGKLLGFAGTFLALPLGAVAGVLVRDLLSLYYKSAFYKVTDKI